VEYFFSELAKARANVGTKHERIIIAHLDTGYDAKHVTLPINLRKDLQRNFVQDGFPWDDATDHTPPDKEFMRNRGHGTGTLSLLAGNKLPLSSNWPGFVDFLGGAALAQIMPVRIANWVVRFSTGTMVQGFGYARDKGAHVLSMSMGGLASHALVDAINLAYEAGMVIVTAAGNKIVGVPSPTSIVLPARFQRVLAACGVMADGRPYAGLKFGTMQGNYGPPGKMDTALGAYTPNVPWAQIDCETVGDMDGAGTSVATPQIAAGVALWLGEHWDVVSRFPEPWMRVAAVREALFERALKSTERMGPDERAKRSVRV
jgi:subtilisin family serine protease